MRILIFVFVAAIAAGVLQAQPVERQVIKLWPEGAPGALGTADKDTPTLTVYPAKADVATGAAMVICPGGGYAGLAAHEGEGYALWLNEIGVTAFVLKYRLAPAYHHPAMINDAARALRLVRSKAADWKIDPKRIGIMGSSAGGHLASTLLTHFDSGNPGAADPIDKVSSRPDLGILCYAVITMGESTHGGSRQNLLGKDPSPELIKNLSSELQVTKETPPCFVWHTFEDPAVPVKNSIDFAAALCKAGVPCELHIYEKGKHGIGLVGDFTKHHRWADDCRAWLRERQFAK